MLVLDYKSISFMRALKNRNDFYEPTYKVDYPSRVPRERAANLKGVRYDSNVKFFSVLRHLCTNHMQNFQQKVFN